MMADAVASQHGAPTSLNCDHMPARFLSSLHLQSLELERHRHTTGTGTASLPSGPAAAAAEGLLLLDAMVTAVKIEGTKYTSMEEATRYMSPVAQPISHWVSTAAMPQLEEYQRASGFSPMLTAAEMYQLCLLLQRSAATCLADETAGEQQALALRRTALAASRQLCELRPSCAAYLLHLAKNTSSAGMETGSVSRREWEAYQAALQAATAEKGEGQSCLQHTSPSHAVGSCESRSLDPPDPPSPLPPCDACSTLCGGRCELGRIHSPLRRSKGPPLLPGGGASAAGPLRAGAAALQALAAHPCTSGVQPLVC